MEGGARTLLLRDIVNHWHSHLHPRSETMIAILYFFAVLCHVSFLSCVFFLVPMSVCSSWEGTVIHNMQHVSNVHVCPLPPPCSLVHVVSILATVHLCEMNKKHFFFLKFCYTGGAFPFTIGRIEHGFNVRPDLCAVENPFNPR